MGDQKGASDPGIVPGNLMIILVVFVSGHSKQVPRGPHQTSLSSLLFNFFRGGCSCSGEGNKHNRVLSAVPFTALFLILYIFS